MLCCVGESKTLKRAIIITTKIPITAHIKIGVEGIVLSRVRAIFGLGRSFVGVGDSVCVVVWLLVVVVWLILCVEAGRIGVLAAEVGADVEENEELGEDGGEDPADRSESESLCIWPEKGTGGVV